MCTHYVQNLSLILKLTLRPIMGNPQFEPGLQDAVFRGLNDSGLYQASHFSTLGRWGTITEFSDPGSPFSLDFIGSLQLCHVLNSISPPNDTGQPLTALEELCSGNGVVLHTLYLTYNLLITPPAEYQLPSLTK